MGYSCRTLLRDTLLRHSSGTLLRDTLVGLSSSSPDTPRTKVVLQGRQFSASSSPDTPRTTVVLQGRQFSASSSTGQIALSPAFRALNTHDLRRGLRAHGTNRTLACISRTRHARSPQRVARAWDKSHSRLRALDTHDLRRGLRARGTNRTLACIWCTRHARSPQRVARQVSKTSVSYETRDFLKNSHVKVCKTSVSYETSSKSQAETPIGAHTSRSPAKQFRDSSPSKQHPLTRQSQWDSDIHLYHNSQPHDSLRLPRELHFRASKPARSPAPATKSDNIIACELQQNLHHTTRLE